MFPAKTHIKIETPKRLPHKQLSAGSGGKEELHPNPLWQTLAFHPAAIQPKLAVGQPDDQHELEADRIADRVMRMPAPQTGFSDSSGAVSHSLNPVLNKRVQRKCDHCEEEEERLQRKAEPALAHQAPTAFAPQVVHDTLRSPGQPLDPSTRNFMEARFARDFGNVRLHTGTPARESAQAVNALAFTVGRDIVLGGRYQSHDAEGRKLLAHELVHVLQQTDSPPNFQTTSTTPAETAPQSAQAGAAVLPQSEAKVQRALDPANEAAWEWFSPGYRRREWRSDYVGTLSAATGAAMELTTALTNDPGPLLDVGPEYDAWRARFAGQVETLVRLNALGLMAAHRAYIEGRRDEQLHPEPGTAAAAHGGAASQLRDAARLLSKLMRAREYLEYSRSAIQLVGTESRTGVCFSMNSCVHDWLQRMLNNIRRYEPPAIIDFWNERIRMLREGVPGDLLRAFFGATARYLADWRSRQLAGVIFSIGEAYNHFPLFRTLNAQSVVEDSDYAADDVLMRAAAAAYGELLNDVDEAIVQIGSGDTSPFSLPVPVRQTRESLPSALRDDFDAVIERHRAVEFWTTMGLTMAQVVAVFIPVVGPAIAFGIGAGMAISDIESLLDRVELAEASTSPEGEILGATGPGPFDYLMSAVQVALTAVDLGMMLRELRGARAVADEAVASTRAEGEAATARAGREEPTPGHAEAGEHPVAGTGSEAPGAAATGETAALERSVHADAHRLGSEVSLADGTHGIAPAGTGRNRGFYFCSDNCAQLTDKLGALLEALPDNYPGREVFAELWNEAGLASGRLRRGALSSEAERAAAVELGTRMNRLAAHYPGAADLLRMAPEELRAQAGAIRTRMSRSLDIAETRLTHGEEMARPPRESTIAPESPEGAAIHDVPGSEVPEGHRMPADAAEARGEWGGERGHSEWFSEVPAVNQITGFQPIHFTNGVPNFRPWARARAILRRMRGTRADFGEADRILMRQYPGRWRTQGEVAAWRRSERLTWHHEPDLETMTLVPRALHANVPHIGGASPAREMMRTGRRLPPYSER